MRVQFQTEEKCGQFCKEIPNTGRVGTRHMEIRGSGSHTQTYTLLHTHTILTVQRHTCTPLFKYKHTHKHTHMDADKTPPHTLGIFIVVRIRVTCME